MSGVPSSIPGAGGRYSLSIGVSSSCLWTARTDVNWADVAPGSGQGNAAPTLQVNRNETFFTRQFTVYINGQTFLATQGSTNCSYNVEPTTLEESAEGGTARITVATAEGCGWSVSASEAWIRVLTPTGTGNATVLLELSPNPSDVRHAFVIVAGTRVDVTQRRRG